MKIKLEENEALIKQGAGNHWRGIEAVGGRLFLTNRRLVFRAHPVNIQAHEASIPLDSIDSVKPGRTFFLIPNQISVHLEDGKVEKYVVWNRRSWIKEIEKMLNLNRLPSREA